MDKEAEFVKMYEEHYKTVQRYVKTILGSSSFAEDVVQDTFLEAWRKFDIIREHPNQGGWLIRTACYKIRNIRKRFNRLETISLDDGVEPSREDYALETKELDVILEKTLNEEERLRFKRYYLWGYTIPEIARLEGISENNARVRISRVIHKLRKEILAVSFLSFAMSGMLENLCMLEKDFMMF